MGGTTFIMTEYGRNVKEVFEDLVEEAVHMYGNDSYNGTISTTRLGNEIKDKKILKAVENNDWKTMDENDNVLYPEKGISNYAIIKNRYKAYSPKWVDKKEFVKRKNGVKTLQEFILKVNGVNTFSTYKTLSETKRAAREIALKTGDLVEVFQKRSNRETFKIGEMQLVTDEKEYKTQRQAKNKIYLPVNKIYFFVFAAM